MLEWPGEDPFSRKITDKNQQLENDSTYVTEVVKGSAIEVGANGVLMWVYRWGDTHRDIRSDICRNGGFHIGGAFRSDDIRPHD